MFPDGTLPLLSTGKGNVVKLSHREASCILAHMFFGTIPAQSPEHQVHDTSFYGLMCDAATGRQGVANAKLSSVLRYFQRIQMSEREGLITIARNIVEELDWVQSPARLTNLQLDSSHNVEQFSGLMQVAFSSARVGGNIDVTVSQEQILFVMYPQLYVTSLLCESLGPREAIVVVGVEQHSISVDDCRIFLPPGQFVDQLVAKRDAFERLPRQIVAIDALRFGPAEDRLRQFSAAETIRELHKAYAGYVGDPIRGQGDATAVVTGKWGCGCAGGCPEYKLVIQWLAAAQAGRELLFCTHGQDMSAFQTVLAPLRNLSVGEATAFLLQLGHNIQQTLLSNPAADLRQVTHQLFYCALHPST